MSVKLLKEIGYKPKMEYWDDFEMAFNVGLLRVQDVFNDFFEDRREDFTDDPSKLIELMLVLQYQYPVFQKRTEKLFESMREKADNLAEDVLSEDAKKYFELLADSRSRNN